MHDQRNPCIVKRAGTPSVSGSESSEPIELVVTVDPCLQAPIRGDEALTAAEPVLE